MLPKVLFPMGISCEVTIWLNLNEQAAEVACLNMSLVVSSLIPGKPDNEFQIPRFSIWVLFPEVSLYSLILPISDQLGFWVQNGT